MSGLEICLWYFGVNRALHSFPTRRSSDLARPVSRHLPDVGTGGADVLGDARDRAAGTVRSEEHTSELQSPYDLVCRLLLEKKKKKKYKTTRSVCAEARLVVHALQAEGRTT